MSGILSIKKTIGSSIQEPRAGYATLFINENGVPLVKDENGTISAFAVASINGLTGAVVLTPANIGAEDAGAASTAMTAHTSASDPHSQYVLETDLSGAIAFELDAHEAATDPHSQYFRKVLANNPNQPVLLDNDFKIPAQFLPALSITDTFVVANELAMLNVIAQRGDFAYREDEGALYVLFGTQAHVLSDWKKLQQNGVVLQVNGKTGASITLTTSDIAEGSNLYHTTARAAAAAPVQSVAGKTGAVTLVASDVGAEAAGAVASAITAHIADTDPHSQYTTTAEAAAAAPVQSVNGKTGAVVITHGDVGADQSGTATFQMTSHLAASNPHPQYTTAAQAAAAAPVQSVNGQTGTVNITAASIQALDVNDLTAHRYDANAHPDLPTDLDVANAVNDSMTAHLAASNPHPEYATDSDLTNAMGAHLIADDPHPQYTTAAEAAAAAPVQSVNGMTGVVVIDVGGGGGGGIADTVINASSSPTYNNSTNANGVDFVAPANSLVANKALEIVMIGQITNTTTTSNLVFEILIDGIVRHTHNLPVGTTARTNAVFRIDAIFAIQTGGASSQTKIMSHGTFGLTPYVVHGAATTNLFNIDYTAAKTIGMRVRSSAASTTGTVLFSSIRDYV